MDVVWIIALISTNLVTGILLVLAFVFDKDGIFNMIKLRFQKGSGLIIVMGKDRKLYMTTAKMSGKKSETEQIDINGLPYNLNRKKIIFYKTHPVLIYDEGVSEPLSVSSGELSYGKVTPELLSQMIILARQSGKMPHGQDKHQQLMFYLAIGTMIASGLSVWFLFNQGDQITAIKNIADAILTAVKPVVTGGA
jgi:hypothetical protein